MKSLDFLTTILEKDACASLAENSEYIPSDNSFSLTICNASLDGTLSNGLITGLKKLSSILSDILEIVSNTSDPVTFNSLLSQYSATTSLVDIFQFKRQCLDIFESLIIFLETIASSLFSNIIIIHSVVIGV